MTTPTKHILQSYLRKLTNLAGNNRSLLLLRLVSDQLMDLHTVSFLNGERSFEMIKSLIAGRGKKLCQVLDSRMEANNEVSRNLKRLQRVDHFIFEERGSNDLHVGWPILRGKFSDGTLVRAPLLFFPVRLEIQNNNWYLQPRTDAGITLNKSFLLAYAFYNKVSVDETLLETGFDDFSSDSTIFRTELYQLLKDKIEINFNPEIFRDELAKFEEFKKDDFESAQAKGEIKLFPEAVLGIFPQAGSQLVPDYLHLLEQDVIEDLEDFFMQRSHTSKDETSENKDFVIHPQAVKEEKIFAPFRLDAYQEKAIQAIKSGYSVVVQGPPGTGKSQLVANLMADAMAAGKRVLLVCQKRAALDVVYSRLKEIELGDFLGLVHDFRNDRRDIFDKIARQIDLIEDYKARNRSVDSIQTERKFFQICRTIDQLVEELDEFRHQLYDDKECGLSAKELYLTSDPYQDAVNIKQEYQYLTFDKLHDLVRKLKSYSNYANTFDAESYPWRERRSFAGFSLNDQKEIEAVVHEIPVVVKKMKDEIARHINVKWTIEECESLLAREDDILGMLSVLKDEATFLYFHRMIEERDEETSMLWLANTERVSMNCFQGNGPERTVPNDQLGKFQEALQTRMTARRSFISRFRWEFFSPHRYWVKRVLVANGFAYNNTGLKLLESRVDNRLNLEHHLTALRQKPWLEDIPIDYDEQSLRSWFERQKLAVRAKLIFNTLREVKDAVSVQHISRAEFFGIFNGVLRALHELPARKKVWLNWMTPYQIRQLTQEPALESSFDNSLKRDFDNLCEFDRLKISLTNGELAVIEKLHDHIGTWKYELLEPLFQNSLRLAWIDHLETKYPVLRSVSSMKMDEMQSTLQQLVAEKRSLSKSILLLRTREKVYDQLEYNRLQNRVTYRDLHHQVSKKKRVWPLRRVIREYADEVFRLMPCWLASPESVSAIFPMEEMFDLVIFDEASQCFSERGVPAMYRGKQLLIAGDSMQLRPSELYQVRWEEEKEDPDLEQNSLLDLGSRYLSTVHLQGHYRSRSPELIDFSNLYFYGGRLRLLPDRHYINKIEPALVYQKVEGQWENQTNESEAAAVTATVMNLIRESPEKDIGVVTFNAPQQMLIMDKLEEASLSEGLTLPPSLFVKNIENVQGDEKDIIIFSVGYAPDKKGKMAMQFGTLNLAGGENRLNVAVTRAREKVIVVSSIWPEQLRIDDIKNDGPKLLRLYLEFVRSVHEGQFKPSMHLPKKQTADWYLNSRLKAWGASRFKDVTFETDSLPFCDLHFLSDQSYRGVILTDDERYAEGLTAKEVHAYTPALLSQKNWDFRLVYSRTFWKDRERLEDELQRFIGSLASVSRSHSQGKQHE